MNHQEHLAARLAANAASKDFAEHDGEEWTNEEVELLMTWDGSDEELTEMGLTLGRTREACRQKYHCTRRQPVKTVVTRTETTTTFYSNWDPEDVSPWYR